MLSKDDKFEYEVTITIGNDTYNCTPDENGVYTIEGSAIKDDINIAVTKTQVKFDPHDVTFTGSGAEDVVKDSAAEKAEHDKDYTFAIQMAEGFAYTVTVDMGGTAVEAVKAEEANEDGSYTYTVAKVTADLTIQIEKSDLTVEVNEYIQLDEQSIFLVTAKQTLPEGKSLSYDGTVMFYSEQYEAWAYLVIVNKGETFDKDTAKAAITIGDAEFTTLATTFDVNESGAVDINDAQLVFDMYNDVYQNFDQATRQKFLKADVTGDRTVNVSDATAIVTEILK